MNGLLQLAFAVFFAWRFGRPLADELGRRWSLWAFEGAHFYGYMFALLIGSIIAAVVSSVLSRIFKRRTNKGGGWPIVLRPVTGFFVPLLGFIPFLAYVLIVRLFDLDLYGIQFFRRTNPSWSNKEIDDAIFFVFMTPFWIGALIFMVMPAERYLRPLGRSTEGLRRMLRVASFGRGGSGSFAGLFSEWATAYQPGSIFLGRSCYGDWKIGMDDDRHLLTIAATGGGKGRTAIIPNLLLWEGSALVIDPKGTNAAVTALARGQGGGRVSKSLGQTVHVVDPFGELQKQGIAIQTACFNPLLELDPASPRIFEDIEAIADGLVVPDKGESHWSEKARGIIAGMIAHVITTEPPENRTLIRVRDLLLSTSPDEFKDVLAEMYANDMAAKLAQETATDFLRAEGSNEMRSIQSTVQKNLKWLLSPSMRNIFSRSDFQLRDLKEKPTTVYLVLPPEEIPNHSRFLRLFVALGIRTLLKREEGPVQPRQKVLFVLDEFLALGRMESMLTAINVGRSFGLKVWPIAQNVNGLAELYGENWQTFVDGAGAIQVFSIGNKVSAQFLAEMFDRQVIARRVPGRDEDAWQLAEVPFRTAVELQEQTGRDMGTQVVLRPGKQALFLKRVPYDKMFKTHQYGPDPDHPRS